jgi:NosR/NirI family nitrous oxide reductase transcriptional regulator
VLRLTCPVAGAQGAGVADAFHLFAIVLLLQFLASSLAAAAELPRFLTDMEAQALFPGADRIAGPQGDPPVAPAFAGDEQLGLVFLTSDYVNTTGYSGKPIHQLVAIDLKGVIRKVLLVEHHEPIVLIGIPEARIVAVLEDYTGLDIGALVRDEIGEHKVDVVTGATVTVMVMDDTILRSAIKVARNHRLGGLAPERKHTGPRAVINAEAGEVESWPALLADDSVQQLALSLEQVNAAFEASGDPLAVKRPEQGEPDESFIELYAAVVSIPAIGRSLLGEAEYRNLTQRLEPGQQAILLAGDGRYSFKGSGYVRGGIFDRFQLVQGDNSIRFHDFQHKRLRHIAAEGAPDLKDVDLFMVPPDQGFDPAISWKLELLVGRAIGATKKAFLTFDLAYSPAKKYLTFIAPKEPAGLLSWFNTDAPDAPLWVKMWAAKLSEIAILLVALGALTLIFFFQTWLVKRPRLTDQVRVGFLVFTLFGIGWYANAQLSVVNILAVFNALISGFDWSYFLMEPLIFILWGSVAASLLFWGRGAYCGWLCPFAALQELLNRVAKLVRIPQQPLPWGLHERLWPLKYLIFLVLFGFSLHSLGVAERLAEVEPFKTAIILKFVRDWPFVLFAVAVLVPGLFIERFYCRYLCPLGAALAIPGRLRMFEWLKRYKECGAPCQRCANECMVQAIHPEGNINVNECMYCLHCQVVYSDDHACPVLIQKRLKRERQSSVSTERTSGVALRVEQMRKKAKADAEVVISSD